ncbi:MAG: ABC transporter ATP-binding protein [Tissierellia bacterium]|nr:ABC transporter ATP-binding protein [Tissierellia bacterium]
MEKILVGKNISKSLDQEGQTLHILKNINLDLEAGEFLAIMGPSGSGKSTLLYALSGLDTITSGQVFFKGRDLRALEEGDLADLRLRDMGFIFQDPSFLRSLNILDNICLPAMKDPQRKKEEVLAQAKELMATVGISGLEKRSPSQVSGGQLQRASLCRALINQPQVLFGDEPTGALNTKTSQEIIGLLRQINKTGTSILLVTHDPQVAKSAHRVVFIKDGSLVDQVGLLGLEEEEKEVRLLEKIQTLAI